MSGTTETAHPHRVVVRGGGDIATGVIQKLHHAGFHVLVLEQDLPLTIRRSVALGSAMREGVFHVEDMTGRRVETPEQCEACWAEGVIPLICDPDCESLSWARPLAVVDAILAKRNLNTNRGMAPVVVGLGPGFSAPEDVDCVIETHRTHSMGRVITCGSALPDTGIPGSLGGQTRNRVIHAPADGVIRHIHVLGDVVKRGEPIFAVGDLEILSPLDGILRGLLAEGVMAWKGLKSADVDPRTPEEVDFMTISDKARAVGGGVVDAILMTARARGILPVFAPAPISPGEKALFPELSGR